MAFQLQDVITAARDRHPAFHRTRITDATFGRFLSDYQNELIAKCVGREPHYLDQSVGIVVSLQGGAPGATGAGTPGGLPASSASPLAQAQQTAGALIDAFTTTTQGATIAQPPIVVTSATATTVTASGASRSVNGDVGLVLEVVAGTGIGQRILVASNTATQWTFATPLPIIPDTSSMVQIVTPLVELTDDMGVVTALPALVPRLGYLVRLNAAGAAFIDYTAPLVANFDVGVPLPSMAAITGGTCYYVDNDREPLAIVGFGDRMRPRRFPAVYQSGESVHFCGSTQDWNEVASIELLYTPIAPRFAALTDLFLLPMGAMRACVAQAAAYAAERCNSMDGISIDVDRFDARGEKAQADYLSSLKLSKRARRTRMRQGDETDR